MNYFIYFFTTRSRSQWAITCTASIIAEYRFRKQHTVQQENFSGVLFCCLAIFLWFAGTNFCGSRLLKFLQELIFAILCSSNMVFSTFILRYVKSKFTLLTYLMENNAVITVISYCTKRLNNSKTKQKPIRVFHTQQNSFSLIR